MRKGLIICAIVLMGAISSIVRAQCSVDISVQPIMQSQDVPEASSMYLASRLRQLVTDAGTGVDIRKTSRFFISGRFDHILIDNLAGPPVQTALHTYLTLYIGDSRAEKILSSVTFELRGVGNSSNRAFINALRCINPANKKLQEFILSGHNKIIEYYNGHGDDIIAYAKQLQAQHDYKAAIWQLSLIPECTAYYAQAVELIEPLVQKYLNEEGEKLYMQALAAWAQAPDETGASAAFDFLSEINPLSESYSSAQTLADEIKTSVKDDRRFELRQKYSDEVQIRRQLINAAREIGVAYGNCQQPVTTNINWVR